MHLRAGAHVHVHTYTGGWGGGVGGGGLGGGIAPLAAVLAVGGPTPLPVKGQREIGGERAVCAGKGGHGRGRGLPHAT